MAHLPPPNSLHNNDNNKGASSSLLSARQRLKQQRELEERRRFGLAPLAVDAEASAQANQTVEISPNVPHTLSQAPWFYEVNGPTLTHQRLDPSKATATNVIEDKIDKVVVLGKASRYVAGACQNCGSKTHKTKECFQAKKKVGAKYTGQVTGVDIKLETTEKTYAQKRDRFVGDVGVDLLKQHAPDEDGSLDPLSSTTTSKSCLSTEEESESTRKKAKVEVFTAAAAQHGGVEIKALPKYLQNLDAMESGEVFFDPKTGSMRGNPNALPSSDHVPSEGTTAELGTDVGTRFQGDLARYRSGDYHLYLEHQHRFLTGATTSFVDFELDKAIGSLKSAQQRDQNDDDDEFICEKNVETKQAKGSSSALAAGKAIEEDVSPDTLAAAAMALGVPLPPSPPPQNTTSTTEGNPPTRNLASLVERLYKVKSSS